MVFFVSWSMRSQITWLGSQLGQCSVFDDESTHEAPPFQCLALSKKFVLGNGWTENPRATNVGFGRWMAYQFVSNSQVIWFVSLLLVKVCFSRRVLQRGAEFLLMLRSWALLLALI
jgi:hypothetical protein